MLIPSTARPWLSPDTRQRPWSNHGAMMIRRREALAALMAAHTSWSRLGLGVLAWALAAGGAVLSGQGIADGGEGAAGALGTGLLLLGTVLAALLVATGTALTRAIAEWWTLATQVGADGGRVDATSGHDTRRAHEAAVATDRAKGAGELWRMPLLLRTLAVAVLLVLTVVLLARAGLGMAEATTPFAGGEVRGPWLAQIVVAAVSLLAALLVGGGLRRVHRARMHRSAPAPASGGSAPAPVGTPALGTGAIVVGGRGSVAGPPPAWAGPLTAAPADGGSPVRPAATSQPAPAAPPAPAATSQPATAVPPAPPAPAAASAPTATPAPAAAPVTAEAPAAPSTAAATPPAPAGVVPTVRLGDGRRLVAGTSLVGRAPQPRPGEQVDATLPVADEGVSKTHLTVTVTPGGVVVVDRGSTNGTVVHHPDGREQSLRPGEPQDLADGDVVVLGATTLTVGDPPDDLEHTVLRAEP